MINLYSQNENQIVGRHVSGTMGGIIITSLSYLSRMNLYFHQADYSLEI